MQGDWRFGLVVKCWPQSMKLFYANARPKHADGCAGGWLALAIFTVRTHGPFAVVQ